MSGALQGLLMANVAAGAAPLSVWSLGEAGGAATAVATGSSPTNGTYSGGVTRGAAGFVTGAGTAVVFDGSTGYVDIGSPVPLNLSRNFTLEAWVKWQAATGCILSYAVRGYYLRIADTGKVQFLQSQIAQPLESVATLAVATRYHLVLTISAAGLASLYVNGAVDSSVSVVGTTFSGDYGLRIGAEYNGGTLSEFFNGAMQNVGIYQGAMSAADVVGRYAAGL